MFHNERLVYTSFSAVDNGKSLPEYYSSDACVPFNLKSGSSFLCPPLDGDVLVRVRHFDKDSGQKISALRLGFNTLFVPETGFAHF